MRHRIKYHYHEQLRIHRKVLSDQTGKKIRQELDFGYIPADISNNGMELQVDPIAEDIKIVPSNKKDSSTQTTSHNLDTLLVDVGVQTDSSKLTDVILTMYSLIPRVCEYLSEHDVIHTTRLIEYMKLLASRSFPMANICYRVFLDFIHWESLIDKRRMEYDPEVKQFWGFCEILFPTQCLDFLRGGKNVLQLIIQYNNRGSSFRGTFIFTPYKIRDIKCDFSRG